MSNPVLVEVTRGGMVESRHRGAFVVVSADGDVLAAAGDIEAPVFPRSAIKVFQALPLVESGAAEAYGFTPAELALACASHGGEPAHVAAARSMLAKAGLSDTDLECGAHRPTWEPAGRGLSGDPTAAHNNCSGKHAGMLALAKYIGAEPRGYINRDHPVQREIAAVISALCKFDLEGTPCGVDGCSVPTWAIPLRNLASGFATLATPKALTSERAAAAARLFEAVAAEPFMVAGTKRFCTDLTRAVPRAFVKTGAEGVFCGCVPHGGLGIALKIDDGASRASERVMAALLARLEVFSSDERDLLTGYAESPVRNWRGIHTGDVRVVAEMFESVR